LSTFGGDDNEIKMLIKQISNAERSTEERLKAVQELRERKEEVPLDDLLGILPTDLEIVTSSVINLLGDIGDERSIPKLVDLRQYKFGGKTNALLKVAIKECLYRRSIQARILLAIGVIGNMVLLFPLVKWAIRMRKMPQYSLLQFLGIIIFISIILWTAIELKAIAAMQG